MQFWSKLPKITQHQLGVVLGDGRWAPEISFLEVFQREVFLSKVGKGLGKFGFYRF